MAGRLFDGDLTIRLAVEAPSLLAGAVIGMAVSQVTVVLTAWRVTRLNIVRALRDLPEVAVAGRRWPRIVAGVAGLAVAVGLYAAASESQFVVLTTPVLGLVSLIPLAPRAMPARAVVVVVGAVATAWVAMVFSLLPDTMDDPEIFMLLVQGVLLVALTTVVVTAGDRLWLTIARRATGGGIASRLGLAEPLARPVRTALLVAMYALVIFTMTFMAVMNAVFEAQAPEFARRAGGGYDLVVEANPTSGLTAAELEADPDVAIAASAVRGWVDGGSPESEEPERGWRLSGLDERILAGAPPPLLERADRYATNREAWAAVVAPEADGATGTTGGGGPLPMLVEADNGLDVGDEHLLYPLDGEPVAAEVVGTFEQGWLIGTWAIVSDEAASALHGDGRPPTQFYIDVVGGADPDAIGERLEVEGVGRGLAATTFLAAALAETDEQEGFINLLQAYLGVGLLIGIAGLGVVLVRAVRERRRQFGVLRALGVAAPVIRRAFVIEAAFVAVQGALLGIATGLLSSWQVLTRSSAIERDLGFAVPGGTLTALVAVSLLASLAMAALPAVRAGRTLPAVALRLTT